MDDDKNILETFKKILQSEGHSVDTAHDGREAIEKSKTQFYNLALLGIKLPDTEATELLTKMHGDTPRMMKIMVTAQSQSEKLVEQALTERHSSIRQNRRTRSPR